MVLKIYGMQQSTCGKRVGLVLLEKEVPFEFHPIDYLTKEHKSPEYLTKQPFGQVPYLDDDGFLLYESRAIGRYIAHKYANQGRKLVPPPSDLKATALFEQACSIEAFNFEPYAVGFAGEKFFGPMRGLVPDERAVKKYLATLDAKLDAYEVILGKQKYLAGDEMTIADLFHLPHGAILAMRGSDAMTKESRPNVARWWNELTALESWKVLVANGLQSTV